MSHIRIDSFNTNNKWIGFGLVNIDTFIIRVRFELTNADITRIRPWTRIATPTESYFRSQPLLTPFVFLPFSLIFL